MPAEGHGVPGRLAAALTSAILLLAAGDRAAAAGPTPLAVGERQPGNVFEPSEPIEVPVGAASDHILWSLTDFDGVEIASGTTALSSGRGTVVIAPPGPGYFELALHAPMADGTGEDARTSFVVAPAPDAGGGGGSRFGVMTHFAQGWETDLVPLIARAGIREVRDEQYWEKVEREPGVYRFPAPFTGYMAALADHGVAPLIVLSFANHLYDRGLTPFSADGREGYARYGRAVLDHYGSQIRAVEIWNEFNGSFCHGPCQDDRPAAYVNLLEPAYRILKASHPDIAIVGGVTANIPLPYLEAVFQKGGLDLMDALSVHPYGSTPEGVGKEIHDLRELATRYGHPELPIWATEFGRGGSSPAGRRDVARYLVRMSTALLGAGVERLYWYLLRDYREFKGMGLVRAPDSEFGRYAPTPAYAAYANLIHQLGDARFVRREGDARAQVYLFARHGQEVRIAWSTDAPVKLRLDGGQERLTVLDVVGRQTTTIDQGSAGALVLEDTPVYIIGSVRRITAVERGKMVADSVDDYSDRQGQAGWSYGYADGTSVGQGPDAAAYDFQPMVSVADPWQREWGQPRYPWLAIGPRDAHPSGSGGHPIWAIRRWTSSASGPVHISGRIIRGAAKGDGVSAHIAVDGRVIFSADLGGASSTKDIGYDVEADLRAGSKVDFIVTPGPHADIDFDSTKFEARIVQDPP